MKIENVSVGQAVKYSQGRGKNLLAKVTKVDTEAGILFLTADKDGRKFSREAALVTSAK